MKKFTWILTALFLFLSCKKDKDLSDRRLLRTEATSYMGNVVNTEYRYDNLGRITSIMQGKANEQLTVAVTVSYNGNEATLLSQPEVDPSLTQTTEVRFTLDASGKPQKRIEYTHRVSKNPVSAPAQEFRYDTSLYEYDQGGLLKRIIRSRRDSFWVEQDYIIKRKFDFTVDYVNSGGNLISKDEHVTYPITTTQNGVTTLSGGSSDQHLVFNYTKSFPNQTDFKNAFILNEYMPYYEPPLNSNYKNMINQCMISNTDRDLNGNIIFNANGVANMDRTYDSKGFLSTIQIPPGSTQDIKINFIYGWK
jgi:hypothetical protein